MTVAVLPLLFGIAGFVLWMLAPSGSKSAEAGRLAFFAGMFVTLNTLAGHGVRLG